MGKCNNIILKILMRLRFAGVNSVSAHGSIARLSWHFGAMVQRKGSRDRDVWLTFSLAGASCKTM